MEKGPTRTFSSLRETTTAFTFTNVLRHCGACTKNYDLSSSLELSQFLKNAANALNDALNDI